MREWRRQALDGGQLHRLLADDDQAFEQEDGGGRHTRQVLERCSVFMCGISQYVNLWGTMVGYTITATISMV
uniref:Uncharacterized protein n=3 Tax=Oryza TaxID=4527 RepID=Q10RV9_ORYSJ|nr:hypothetical protein LOC_Os03g05080 [Oryza sativa Japonica Group]